MANITLNGEKVVCEPNENKHYRGLHIVIVNPSTMKSEFAKVFDTYKDSSDLEVFVQSYNTSNKIVVAACRDECS